MKMAVNAVTDDAELAGLVQSIIGLDRPGASSRKIGSLSPAQRRRYRRRGRPTTDLSAPAREQERWLKQASDLDRGAARTQSQGACRSCLSSTKPARARTRRADLYRERGQVLTQLADLSRKQAEETASQEAPLRGSLHSCPGDAICRFRRASISHRRCLLGSLPLTAAGLILAAIWAATLYGRTKRLGEKYEELLTRHVA